MPRKSGSDNFVVILIVSLLTAGFAVFILGPVLLSFVSPPISWIRPQKVHLNSLDNGALLLAAPLSYARSFACDLNPQKDIMFSRTKPSGWLSDQWEYREGEKEWAWIFDYQDNHDCAPNIGIVVRETGVVQDPRLGIAEISFDVYIIVSSDPWLGAITPMEAYIAPKNSYFVLTIKAPHPVIDFYSTDGQHFRYFYNTDGSVQLIIEVPHSIPSHAPIVGALADSLSRLGLWGLIWIDKTGTTYHRQMRLVVKTSSVISSPTATIIHSLPTQTGIGAWYPGTVTTVTYTRMVTATVTHTVTSFPVVHITTTVVRGTPVERTVTLYTTRYDTATFTYTGLRTEVVTQTVTVDRPVTITRVVERTVTTVEGVPEEVIRTVREIPWWVWAGFLFLMMIYMITVLRARGASSSRPVYRYRDVGRPPRLRLFGFSE